MYPAFLFPKRLGNQLYRQVSFDETRWSIETVGQIGSYMKRWKPNSSFTYLQYSHLILLGMTWYYWNLLHNKIQHFPLNILWRNIISVRCGQPILNMFFHNDKWLEHNSEIEIGTMHYISFIKGLNLKIIKI